MLGNNSPVHSLPQLAEGTPFVAVAAVDVGKPDNIGLAIRHMEKAGFSGSIDRLDEFVRQIESALSIGAVALGFECPCFLPLREDAMAMTKQRCGESGKPWSAMAGMSTAVLAAPVAGHILRKIHNAFPNARPILDYSRKMETWQAGEMLLFEGFVSGAAKGNSDREDAQIVVDEFTKRACSWPPKSDVVEKCVVNLIAAALLATGWDIDKSMLSQPCLVVKP